MMMEPDESENISSKTKREQSVDDKTFEKISVNSGNETIIVKK